MLISELRRKAKKNTQTIASCLLRTLLISLTLATSCTTARTSRTFQGDGFALTYPSSWRTIGPNQMRKQPGFELLFAAHSPDDGTSVNLIHTTLEHETTAERVDQEEWIGFLLNNPDAILSSREIIEVGGQSAVRRIFSVPVPNTPSGRAHILQIYIVRDHVFYLFTGWAPSADTMEQHRPEIESIVASIRFTP